MKYESAILYNRNKGIHLKEIEETNTVIQVISGVGLTKHSPAKELEY